ncbi:hypothetical protein MRX96_024832 [Rhipicephalus microplus]
MSNWEPAEKRAFRLGARNFYLKATGYLLSRLPFQNMTLRSLRCFSPNAREEESSGSELRPCLASPHGNADVERGFSENRRLLQDRARLTLESFNGIRHVVCYGECFDSDPSSFTITPEVLKVVRNSKKRYSERLALQKEQSAKRPREEPEAVPNSEGQDLQKEVETAKKMLTNAELLIAHGLKTKDFAEVESGNSLLASGKSRLEMAIQKMAGSKNSLPANDLSVHF